MDQHEFESSLQMQWYVSPALVGTVTDWGHGGGVVVKPRLA